VGGDGEVECGDLAKDCCNRTGPAYVKMARRIYYRGSDLIAYVQSCTQPTNMDAALKLATDKATRKAKVAA
jgi:hypothetical protein